MASASPESRLSSSRAFDFRLQRLERLLRLVEHRLVALGLSHLGERERIVDLALDLEIAVDAAIEPRALAHQCLRARRIIPEFRIFDCGVQLGEAARRVIPVKDASSAAPTTTDLVDNC